jgi:hypothetical protein
VHNPPIDNSAVNKWINDVQTLKLNGARPTANSLISWLKSFWLPDETALYIGKTKQPLFSLTVFYAHTANPEIIEQKLLGEFVKSVSQQTKILLYDPAHLFPFANMEYPPGVRKDHNITGATHS